LEQITSGTLSSASRSLGGKEKTETGPCPRCGETKRIKKNGFGRLGQARYRCICGKSFMSPEDKAFSDWNKKMRHEKMLRREIAFEWRWTNWSNELQCYAVEG
jgi:predicted RNA-binding Zn-ribbon protein involved in translation (DUF1610 family)